MYFLDTYAIIEHLKGNPKAVEIVKTGKFVTSNFQLMELYYYALKDVDEESADRYFEAFSSYKVSISEAVIKKAMKLRLKFQKKRKRISYVDAIGYAYSLEKGLKFVTGDKEFKGLKGVKYIGK